MTETRGGKHSIGPDVRARKIVTAALTVVPRVGGLAGELGGPSVVFFFQAEDGIRDLTVTGVQTCALPICRDAQARELGLQFARLCVAAGELTRRARQVALALLDLALQLGRQPFEDQPAALDRKSVV